MEATLERTRIQFAQSNTSTRDLSFLVTLVPVPRQRIGGEFFHQLLTLIPAKLGNALVSSYAALVQQRLNQASRQMASHNRSHRARALPQQFIPGWRVQSAPLYEDRLRWAACLLRLDCQVRDV